MQPFDFQPTGILLSTEYPEFFYKYRGISNHGEFEKDYSIDALIKNKAIFSTRTNFNDLFDSKIELITPTPRQVKTLGDSLDKNRKAFFRSLINHGKFTDDGANYIERLKRELNSLIDSYNFFCVSSRADSNLMWSHYGDCHRGFCIEFKAANIRADKVIYQKTIPQVKVIELMKVSAGVGNEALGGEIWTALRTKLDEWAYEQEYRFQAGTDMPSPKGQKFIPRTYQPDWIESIIFGCKMPQSTRDKIVKLMPENTKFKMAVEKISTVEIVPYKRK